MKHSITIRMGAAEWSISTNDGTRIDLRALDRDGRRKVHGVFMDAYRKSVGAPAYRRPKRRRRPQNRKAA